LHVTGCGRTDTRSHIPAPHHHHHHHQPLTSQTKIVFASSDKSESEFRGYLGEMSWDLALPFGAPQIRQLSGLCKVSGIPTLVVIDKDGNIVTKDGRKGVITDPEGAQFPWKPKTVAEIIQGGKGGLVDKAGAKFDTASHLAAHDYVLLYFSAHWCPPCRRFTPELAKWYTKQVPALAAAGTKVEIVFVSSDNDKAGFEEYMKDMPWKALAYEDRDVKEELSEALEVEGIPTLALLDKAGNVMTTEARGKISSDPDGFPWLPKPVETLSDAASTINSEPWIVLWTDKLTSATAEVQVNEAFRAAAAEFWGADGRPTSALRFAVAAEGDDTIDSVRDFLGASRDKDGPTAVRVDLLDIPKQRRAVLEIASGSIPTKEDFVNFARDYLGGATKFVALRG
jgi:nucleoredoxin